MVVVRHGRGKGGMMGEIFGVIEEVLLRVGALLVAGWIGYMIRYLQEKKITLWVKKPFKEGQWYHLGLNLQGNVQTEVYVDGKETGFEEN
jgi:hypothetical protein